MPSTLLILVAEKSFVGLTTKNTGKLCKPYFSFVIKLSNVLNDLALKNQKISTFLEKVVGWKEYVAGELADINKKETTKLGALPGGESSGLTFGDRILYNEYNM